MLKSSFRDCSTKSSTDFAHYYLWLFSTLWWNTSHQLQCKIFYSKPPPHPPYLLSASVMSPFHIFTFTSRKQLAVQILRKLKFVLISQYQPSRCLVLNSGWAQIKRKREMAALAFLSHLPYCTCQAIAFLLVMYHLWIYWYPKLCVSSTLFYVFYTPRKKWYWSYGIFLSSLINAHFFIEPLRQKWRNWPSWNESQG